jgi:plasmid replication initiation protein
VSNPIDFSINYRRNGRDKIIEISEMKERTDYFSSFRPLMTLKEE